MLKATEHWLAQVDYDLAQQDKLNLSQSQRDFFGKINNASIATRYPADLTQLIAQYSAPVIMVRHPNTES